MKCAVIALLLVAGCNQVFDIVETKPVETLRDSDGDGVYDDADNCIDVPNADQLETDGDALGDACDACPGAVGDSNHDEDLDERPDACDPCPGIVDFPNTDGDQDGVGDACDLDSHATARLHFEPFVTVDPGWQFDGEWTSSSDDTVGPTNALPAGSPGLSFTGLALTGKEWTVHLGVRATRPWEPGDRAGIVLVDATGSQTSCTVLCEVTIGCRMRLVVDKLAPMEQGVGAAPEVQLDLVVKETDPTTGARSYTCGSAPQQVTLTYVPASSTWTPGIVASPTLRVSYIDVLQ